MIYVLYATKVGIGGWATFTRHLVDTLRACGHHVCLCKVGNKTELFDRPFGPDHEYVNISADELVDIAAKNQMIIAALGKHYVELAERLIARGAGIVVHDTAESTNRMAVKRPWVIRKSLAPLFGDAVFIRHPYIRHTRPAKPVKRTKAIYATSRVDFDKNTAMILDANRLGADIKIVGFENRLYTRFKICPDYPEWEQSTGLHPRTGAGSFELLLGARAMVDLTDIKGDGGGTQYTFLEAWDAGAVPIIGDWWWRLKDDMQPSENCLAVSSAKDLRNIDRTLTLTNADIIAQTGASRLKRYHSPKVLGPQIMEWLNALG